jgi:hypothetical protein
MKQQVIAWAVVLILRRIEACRIDLRQDLIVGRESKPIQSFFRPRLGPYRNLIRRGRSRSRSAMTLGGKGHLARSNIKLSSSILRGHKILYRETFPRWAIVARKGIHEGGWTVTFLIVDDFGMHEPPRRAREDLLERVMCAMSERCSTPQTPNG